MSGSKTLWFRPGGSGSFTLNATASDAQSGVGEVVFPDVSGTSGWSGSTGGSDGSSPFASPADYSWTAGAAALGSTTIVATNGAGLSASDSLTVSADSTAPSGQSVGLVGGPFYASLSVPLSLSNGSDSESGVDSASGVVERSQATLAGGSCGSFGSWSAVTLSGGADTSVATDTCYRYRYTISDNVGNSSAASSASATAKVDTSAPTVEIDPPTVTAGAANQYYNAASSTLWFRPAGSGSFTLNATASAGGSGIADVSFPDLSSFDGFSGSGGPDTSSPYSSTSYSWTAAAAGNPDSQDIVATSNSTTTATASITISPDSTAPSGQSATLVGGPWYSTLSVPVTIDNGTDTSAGIDPSSVTLERSEATLSNGNCGSFGSWSTVTLTGGADTTVTAGNCYRYRVTVSDRVGNTSSPSPASASAKVGTATPTVTATAPTAISGAPNQYWAADTKTLYFRPAGSGSFQLTATATDDAAGIDHVTFPDLSSLNGFSGSGGNDSTDPYTSTTYAWTTDATGNPGAKQIVATSNSSQTGSDTVTITPDSTGPSGQTTTLAGGPWYTSLSVPLTLDLGTDTGSGLDTSSLTIERAETTLTNGTCGTFSTWSTITLTGGADTTVQNGNCYRYRITLNDNVGNQSAASTATADAKIDTTAPSAPNLAVSEASAFSYATGTTLYYNPQGSNTGSFDVAATSTDPQSGIAKIAFPAVTGTSGGGDDTTSPYFTTYDWTSSTSTSGAQTVTAHNTAGLTANTTFTLTPDTTAPTGQTINLSTGPWYTTPSIPLTIDTGTDTGAGIDNSTLAVERASATLTAGSCGTFGSWSTVTLTGEADTTVVSGNCYRYRITISDNVGNTSSPSTASANAKIDTTAPSVAVTAPTAVTGTTNQYYQSGSKTLWFRPTGTGSLTLNATASDPQSGVQVGFPDVSGTTGWAGSTGGTDTTSPYSYPADYTWTTGATQLGSTTITATNGAGLSAADSLTISADSTAPTGQTATLTAGPWYTPLSVALTLDNGTDTESGLDTSSGVVERATATLTGGTCGSFGTWSTVTLTAGADTTVTSGNCYRYRYTTTDNVGNTSSPSTASSDAKVDTTAPSTPALTLSESSPLSYVSGTTLYYNAQGTNTASFTVDGTSTDAQSGIQKLTFPNITGITGGGDDTTSPYQGNYTWTNATAASGNQTVTSYNGASTTATSTFTVTKDTTAPTGQTADLAGGPWYTTLSVPLTLDNGTDSGAGVDAASGVVERATATLTNGTCGSFGTWNTVTLTGGADTTVTSGNCYRYRYTITDNVGNTSAPSTATADAKVDTTAPSTPTLTLNESSPLSSVSGTTLYYNPQGSNTGTFTATATSSDAQSGIEASASRPCSAPTGGGTDTSSPYSRLTTGGAPATRQRGQDRNRHQRRGPDELRHLHGHARHDSTDRPDDRSRRRSVVQAPPPSQLALDNGSDAGSGLDTTSQVVERASAALTIGTCGTFGPGRRSRSPAAPTPPSTSGNCYRYRIRISDNVGNTSSNSTATADAKIDTSAPGITATAPTAVTGTANQYYEPVEDALVPPRRHRLIHPERHRKRPPV